MTTTDTGRVYRRHPEASFTRFGSEMLVVVPRQAWQIVLNGIGGDVFQMLDGRRSVGELAVALAAEYEGPSPDEIAADVLACLADLETKGAVVPVDPQVAG